MRLRYFLMGLVCGMTLMGVALGGNTTVYVGQMSTVGGRWMDLLEYDERGYAERKMEKQVQDRGRMFNEYRLIDRTTTETELRRWDRQP